MRRELGPLLVLVAVVGISGCGRYYWTRASTTADQFHRDSQTCARESIAPGAALRPGVGVDEQAYRRCLAARGYRREPQWEPVPDGWYRGIE